MSDMEKLLRDVLFDAMSTVFIENMISLKHAEDVIKERLLPLLEAGQAMPHDHSPSFDVAKNSFRCEPDCPRCAWDAALEKAKGK